MSKKLTLLFVLFIIGLASYTAYYRLGDKQISMWDESRYAVNALEMTNSDNPLIVTFNGKPDYWNSKPPMAVWLMAISLKTFGFNELAIRIPSATAFILSIVLILLFSGRVIGNYIPGIIASLALISTTGVLRHHGARSGDVDSLLTLFILGYILSYFTILLQKKNRTLLFGLFTTSLIMAFLTKGIAALIPLPGLFICTLLYKNLIPIIKSWQLYASIALFLTMGIGYYILRDYYDPKYIDAITKQDLSMFTSERTYKRRFFLFYFDLITNKHFYPYAFFIPITVAFSFFTKNEKINKALLYSLITAITFVLVHSFSKIKNEWYEMPVYPLLAITFGYSLYIGFSKFKTYLKKVSPIIIYLIAIVSTISIFAIYYIDTLETLKPPTKIYIKEWEGKYMRDLSKRRPEINKYTVKMAGRMDDQARFYMVVFNKNLNFDIRLKQSHNFEIGETILSCHKADKTYIQSNYYYTTLDSTSACHTYRIDSLKQEYK